MKLTQMLILIITIGIIVSACKDNPEITSPKDNFASFKDNSASSPKDFDSLQIQLYRGESMEINKEITIKFDGIANDSRYLVDSAVWKGNAEVNLTLSSKDKTEQQTLNTHVEPSSISFEGYLIYLRFAHPQPIVESKPGDQVIGLTIK